MEGDDKNESRRQGVRREVKDNNMDSKKRNKDKRKGGKNEQKKV